ncbi:MAG: carboxylate-amine ligase, partial [Acidobacteria bacterium]
MNPTFTIGIEEEYQTVDPVTRDLRSHIHAEIIEKGKLILQERVKAEMHASVVEVGTSVCDNIKDCKHEVRKLRRDMIALAKENGLRLASAATHPFADWRMQEITADERYKNIVEDLQLVARANLIFGLHVHIGVEDRETAIHLMNHARYFLPHILALSTNSPFWLGMNTGLHSYRCKVFDKFPRTNIPDYFPSWGEYENFIKLLIKTGCIDNAKKIWWDIRPHPFFNTLEFRVCDIP